MSTNTSQFQSPYLLATRKFPTDPVELEPVLSKSYIDTANVVNVKTTGIYEKLQVAIADKYYNNGSNPDFNVKRQAYRQVYTLAALPNTGTTTIPVNFVITANTQFVNIYGTVESSTISVAFTPWNMTRTDDAPYLRVNRTTNNIEVVTNSGNWTGFSAMIVLEYILG